MSKYILYLNLLIFPSITLPSTPEDKLLNCYNTNIIKYQPIDTFDELFSCTVRQKTDPFNSPPQKGPFSIARSYPGYEILSIYVHGISNAGGSGGHTPPFISANKQSFNATMWCRAEDTLYGARGLYDIKIAGSKKRIPTSLEERKVLQYCSDSIFQPEGK